MSSESSIVVAPPSPSPSVAADRLSPAWVLGWAAYWLGTFGVFHLVMIPAGFGHYERSYGAGLLYLSAACLGALLFRREISRQGAAGRVGWGPAVALLAVAGLSVGVCAWAATVPLPEQTAARFRELEMGVAALNGRYFVSKLPELVFQQTLIYVLVRRIEGGGRSGWALCGAFALVFAGLHLPLVVLKGWAGVPFVVLSACSALVFPPLISRFPGGVGYSFAVHLLTYLGLGVFIRVGL